MADPVKPNPSTLVTPDAQAAARKEAQEAAKKQLDEADKARAEAVKAQAERHAKSKPTPTQRENDLAKLGLLGDEKEDDGSGPNPALARQAAADDNYAKYSTRDMAKK